MLVTENQQPVAADDVQYLGPWDFSCQGMFSEQLDAIIATGK